MAQWRKSPPSLIALFDAMVPEAAGVERRKMFGYPCAFVNGNMFIGLHQEDFIVRLGEADRAEIGATLGATAFEPMQGRPMREYVTLPEAVLEDEAAVGEWVARSYEFAASLPPKEKKPGRKKAS